MLCVALWSISGASLWRDEASTLSAIRRPLPDLWHMLGRTDAVHGLYYLLMWPVARLIGMSELGLRLPSAIAVSAAALGVAALGRQLVSSRAGLMAGLFFALLPVTSRYGQEARSYALVMALAVLASYLLVRADAAPVRPGRWLGCYALVVVVMGYANVMSLLLVPAHAVTLRNVRAASASPGLLGPRRAHRVGWLIAVTASPDHGWCSQSPSRSSPQESGDPGTGARPSPGSHCHGLPCRPWCCWQSDCSGPSLTRGTSFSACPRWRYWPEAGWTGS
jgi:uncharacterized membrane protein